MPNREPLTAYHGSQFPLPERSLEDRLAFAETAYKREKALSQTNFQKWIKEGLRTDSEKARADSAEVNHSHMAEMYAEEKVNADENREWAQAAEKRAERLAEKIREWQNSARLGPPWPANAVLNSLCAFDPDSPAPEKPKEEKP